MTENVKRYVRLVNWYRRLTGKYWGKAIEEKNPQYPGILKAIDKIYLELTYDDWEEIAEHCGGYMWGEVSS